LIIVIHKEINTLSLLVFHVYVIMYAFSVGVNDGVMKKYMSVESLKPTASLAVDTECKRSSVPLLLLLLIENNVHCIA